MSNILCNYPLLMKIRCCVLSTQENDDVEEDVNGEDDKDMQDYNGEDGNREDDTDCEEDANREDKGVDG